MNKTEAIKQALDFLMTRRMGAELVIDALQEALAEQPAQPQQEPWEHLKAYGYAPGGYMMTCRGCNTTVTGVDKRASRCMPCATKTAEQPAQQEPVAFLANGTRFKISYDSRQSGGQIHGIPPELGGRWVAFVAADDDCHLKLTSPPPQRTWVGLTDEERIQFVFRICNLEPYFADPLDAAVCAIEAKLKEKNNGIA